MLLEVVGTVLVLLATKLLLLPRLFPIMDKQSTALKSLRSLGETQADRERSSPDTLQACTGKRMALKRSWSLLDSQLSVRTAPPALSAESRRIQQIRPPARRHRR